MVAETLWLPRVTYIKGKTKATFIYNGKPMPKYKAADVFQKIFDSPGTSLKISFKRMRT